MGGGGRQDSSNSHENGGGSGDDAPPSPPSTPMQKGVEVQPAQFSVARKARALGVTSTGQVLLKFIARRPTRAPHQRYAFVSTSRDEGLRLHLPDSKTKPHLTVKAVLYGLSVRMRAGRGATADAEDEVCFHVETIECGDVDFMCTGVEQAKDWVLGLQLQLQNVTEGEVMRQRAVLVDAGMSPFKVGKAKPIKNKATTQERKFRRLAISAETSAEMKANEKRRKESLTQVQYVQKVIKKSEDASARIRAALKGNFLFSALKGKNLSDLVLAMEEVQVVDGEVLIQQGDKGDNFYVVENGEYEVLVDDNKVAKLGRGASFGELALMYNCPRAATIRAAGPGSVWQVDRSTFVHLVVNASMGSSEAQFLREVALFQHVKEVHLLEVAAKMERKNYNRNAVIEKEGQEGTCMYIVFSGEVEVGSRKSGKWVSYKTYSRNDFLGERALMTGGKRQAEIRAKTACKLLVLDKPQYENLQFALEEPLTDLLKMDCLQSIPALQALTGTQLGEVVDEFKKREVSKGEVIIKQGALCKELSIIRSGSVIEKKTGTTYGAWKAFGEQGLVENSRATSNFEAQEDCVLLYLEQDAFTHMIGPLKEVMTRNVNLKILQSVPLFESLSEAEMMTVADSLKEKDYTKGEFIVKQNDHGHDMYILKTGEVVVTKSFGEGEPPKELVRMKEGSFFGERALLTNEPRAANIVASKRCKCYSISREVFEKSLGSLKEIMEAHTKKLEERKQELNLRFTDLKIMRTIGMGQFGRVKIVQHKITKACYALKCLRKAAIFEAGQEEHIRMERVIMNKIGHHPFIMKLVRSFKDKAQVYMLLELTPGGELFKYLDESELGYFPEAQAKFYAACVVSAFEQMHGRNVLYRDLKPENLLLDAQGYIKVVDMGFAKEVQGKTFTLCGTPDYLAPEIITRKGHNKGVDYWALGVLIYEMLVGEPPFTPESNDPKEIYNLILSGNFKVPPTVSKDAKDIIKRLLCVNLENRLGLGKRGIQEIKKHKWFSDIDFNELERKKIAAPLVPNIKDPTDVSNFDKYDEADDEPDYTGDASILDKVF